MAYITKFGRFVCRSIRLNFQHQFHTSGTFLKKENKTSDFDPDPEKTFFNESKRISVEYSENCQSSDFSPVYKSLYDSERSDHRNTILQLGETKSKLLLAESSAAKLEFLITYRNKIVKLEDYASGFPTDDKDYLKKFHLDKRFQEIDDCKLLGKKHKKRWLWLLAFGDEEQFTQLKSLRTALKQDIALYIWFSCSMQMLFEVMSEDIHSDSRMFDLKYFDPSKIKDYVKFLSCDMQKAAIVFFISEGLVPSTENPVET